MNETGAGRESVREREISLCKKRALAAAPHKHSSFALYIRPQIRRDYPLNLSILLGGGKETNKDSPSSGERTGRSPARNPAR